MMMMMDQKTLEGLSEFPRRELLWWYLQVFRSELEAYLSCSVQGATSLMVVDCMDVNHDGLLSDWDGQAY